MVTTDDSIINPAGSGNAKTSATFNDTGSSQVKSNSQLPTKSRKKKAYVAVAVIIAIALVASIMFVFIDHGSHITINSAYPSMPLVPIPILTGSYCIPTPGYYCSLPSVSSTGILSFNFTYSIGPHI